MDHPKFVKLYFPPDETIPVDYMISDPKNLAASTIMNTASIVALDEDGNVWAKPKFPLNLEDEIIPWVPL